MRVRVPPPGLKIFLFSGPEPPPKPPKVVRMVRETARGAPYTAPCISPSLAYLGVTGATSDGPCSSQGRRGGPTLRAACSSSASHPTSLVPLAVQCRQRGRDVGGRSSSRCLGACRGLAVSPVRAYTFRQPAAGNSVAGLARPQGIRPQYMCRAVDGNSLSAASGPHFIYLTFALPVICPNELPVSSYIRPMRRR